MVRTKESSTGISTETPTRQTQEAKQVDVRQDHRGKAKGIQGWQEQQDARQWKEYRDLCTRVRRAVKEDKEKWLDGVRTGR